MPKQPKSPSLTSDDQDTWHHYSQTVKPLHPKNRKKNNSPDQHQEKISIPKKLPIQPTKTTVSPIDQGQNLDSHWHKRLVQGKMPIEAIIDLHGLTQNQAHQALLRFIEQSITKKRRVVLVVTGKGKEGKGVIKQNFLHWLNQSPYKSAILSVIPAQKYHGGDGASYILFRRYPI